MQRQRLFDKNVLARLQCLDHLIGVEIVLGGNHHRIDGLVGQHGLGIGRSKGKPLSRTVMCSARAAAGHQRVQLDTGRLKGRHQNPRGIVSATEKSAARRIGGATLFSLCGDNAALQ